MNPFFLAIRQQIVLVQTRVQLYLIYGRFNPGSGNQLFELAHREVRHAYVPHLYWIVALGGENVDLDVDSLHQFSRVYAS